MDTLNFIPIKALIRGTKNKCNCDSRYVDGKDFGELSSMKSLPITAVRYGGALSSISKMNAQMGSLKCIGKNGVYPSEIDQQEKRALEKRLNVLNETLIEHMRTTTTTTTTTTATTIPPLPSGYKKVKSDFGMVFYKFYKVVKTRVPALKTCADDASFLHFPQPTNKQENLFYYDLIHPDIGHGDYTTNGISAIWLDISKSNSWSNWVDNFSTSSRSHHTTMIFKTGERDKNWNRVPTTHNYYFVCTAVFK